MSLQLFPERLPLYSRDCKRIYWHVSSIEAQELLRSGKVKALGTKTRVRALRWLAPGESPEADKVSVGRRHYSHNRETADNPHGVWTLTSIPAEDHVLFSGWMDVVVEAAA